MTWRMCCLPRLFQYWMYVQEAQFRGNPAALVHACDGVVARLLETSFEMWRADPDEFRHPRSCDHRFVWDLERLADLRDGTPVDEQSLRVLRQSVVLQVKPHKL
jgi:hypothetical protein